MDRQIIYPGSIPLDTDLLSIQRNTLVALGYLAQATLGSTTVVDGLACTPTAPASLTVSVGPGSITTLAVIDASPFGSLPADNTDPLVKTGINTGSVTFSLSAPTTSGQAINYLLQANLGENDSTPIVLPYYNAADPAQPFSGAANNGTSQNTQRQQRVQLQLKPSPPANTGAQINPAVDSGWVGLYIITVSYGQTQIATSDIVVMPTAPFIGYKLNTLTPGFSRLCSFTASGSFMVPAGTTLLKARVCGGGGGGGTGLSGMGGGGGGAGGYAEGVLPVLPGQIITATVGSSGSAGVVNGNLAGAGGTSIFGPLTATGGSAGANAAAFAPGGGPGYGSGGTFNVSGGYGSDGNGGSFVFPGNGGASFFGGGGRAASAGSAPQQNGQAYGSGAGACYGVSGNGGAGAPGIVILEY